MKSILNRVNLLIKYFKINKYKKNLLFISHLIFIQNYETKFKSTHRFQSHVVHPSEG